MHMPIAIEPVAGNGYRARGGEPLAFTAEGATPEEAVRKLRELIQAHLASGVQIGTCLAGLLTACTLFHTFSVAEKCRVFAGAESTGPPKCQPQ
jgi:predicted RNase H-like HicB family nuclease